MPSHNLLSTKAVLKEAVKQGQVVSLDGHLANMPEHPEGGIAMYDGDVGDTIAICLIGFIDVPIDFEAHVGLGLQVENGILRPVQGQRVGFVTVTAVNGKVAEVLVGVKLRSQENP